MRASVIETKDFACARVRAVNGPAGARSAFDELESRIGSLRGKKMYGVFYPDPGNYFACVKLDDQQSDDLGLETETVPGGRYARRTIRDWSGKEELIKDWFDELIEQTRTEGIELDPSRPSIEFYRSHRKLVIMVPVK